MSTERVKTRRTYTPEELETILGITEADKAAAAAELDRLEQEGKVERVRLDEDDAERRLWANVAFRKAIEQGRASRARTRKERAEQAATGKH